MPILEIEGRRVEVDESFLQMTPEQQSAAVDEIGASLGLSAQPQEQAGNAGADGVLDAGTVRPPQQPTGVGSTGAGLMGYADTASFGFADELTGAIGGVVEGLGRPEGFMGAYERVRDNTRRLQQQVSEESPVAYTGGQIGGGVATALIPGGAVARGASLGTKALRGAGVGAAYGGAYGFGSGDGNLEQRVNSAAKGAAQGAAVGAAFAPVAAGVGGAYRGIRNAMTNRAAKGDMSQAVGQKISSGAVNRIRRAFDDEGKAGTFRPATEGDMLLNQGDQFMGQASAIARAPGAGQSLVKQAVRGQKDGASDRVLRNVNATMGKDAGRVTDEAVVEAERKAAGRLYTVARAQSTPVDVRSVSQALDDAIDGVDGSIRTKLESLRKLRVFEGGGTSDAKFAHAARIEIDDMISEAGRGTNAARILRGLRSEIDTVLKTEVPGYAQADKAYSQAIASRTALEDGRNIFKAATAPDELEQMVKGMSPMVRDRFIKGARDEVSRIMGTARNDAMAVYTNFAQKGWNREKLAVLFGKPQADRLVSFLEREAARNNAANTITGNSVTAAAQAAQREFPSAVGQNQVQQGDRTLTGIGINMAVKLANKLTSGAVDRRNARISEDAAKLLTATGATRDKIVSVLQNTIRKHGANSQRGKRAEALLNGLILGQMPAALASQSSP
jgi:hypothetical protein